jgi:hypothetical protein
MAMETKQVTYKEVDLFGNDLTVVRSGIGVGNAANKSLFDDYEGFVGKFEPKKTTDDCYTPDEVYKCVLDYVKSNTDLTDKTIVRPFYPGGDYEAVNYTLDMVVIDNPPFSIISKIVRFYENKSIPYFLFAPHLTLLQIASAKNYVVCGASVRYANGAVVKTSFVSNIGDKYRILTASKLKTDIEEANKQGKVSLPAYRYPDNLVTVSRLQKLIDNELDIAIEAHSCARVSALDAQKSHNKGIFGSGLFVSDSYASHCRQLEVLAAGRAAGRAAEESAAAIVWELSHREKSIIASLK